MTESLLLDDVGDVITKMSALRQDGVSFSLDDFGTGYSSLFYLKHLPLDQLKIDQSFVRDVLRDSNDAVITQTIIRLGQSLGLAVIAEGVEEVGQLDFLRQQGCKSWQGFYFGHPMPVDELERFLCQSDAGHAKADTITTKGVEAIHDAAESSNDAGERQP